MVKLSLDEEKDAVDLVTNCMFSLDFLKSISHVIFSEHRDKVSVGDFYDKWLRARGAKEYKIPFNPGAVVAYLYCGLVLTKELWYDLVSDEPISAVAVDWSLSDITFSAPKKQSPSARYFLRRIRNSLAHGNIRVKVPKGLRDKSEIMQRVSVCFHDDNPRDPSDVFDAEATLYTLAQVIRRFQGEVHRNVRAKTVPVEPNPSVPRGSTHG